MSRLPGYFSMMLVLLLAACWGPQMTAQTVVDKFSAAGLAIGRVAAIAPQPGDGLPAAYREQVQFEIPEITPRGGKIFVCERKPDCDAISQVVQERASATWPYRYQSPDGTVVVLLPKNLSAATAEKFAAVVTTLP